MKNVFLNSVYTMEPNTTIRAWDNHWNYEWSGRNSIDLPEKIKYRVENDNTYIVKDKNGIVWRMDKEDFDTFIKEHKKGA
jgi:hypothetical protein